MLTHPQLQKLAFKIINSTTVLQPMWYAYLEELKLSKRVIPQDVTAQWNSTFEMLDFCLKYQPAIDKMTTDRKTDLRSLELNNTDWDIARQLRDVPKVFKDATLFFSRATPNLATVIPAMDLIDQRLTTDSINRKLAAPIQSAISLAQKTLNKYYTKTDLSEVYRIAIGAHDLVHLTIVLMCCCTVLHPRHKLTYFKKVSWETEWINTAEEIVHEEFKRSYMKSDDTAPPLQVEVCTSCCHQ